MIDSPVALVDISRDGSGSQNIVRQVPVGERRKILQQVPGDAAESSLRDDVARERVPRQRAVHAAGGSGVVDGDERPLRVYISAEIPLLHRPGGQSEERARSAAAKGEAFKAREEERAVLAAVDARQAQ